MRAILAQKHACQPACPEAGICAFALRGLMATNSYFLFAFSFEFHISLELKGQAAEIFLGVWCIH